MRSTARTTVRSRRNTGLAVAALAALSLTMTACQGSGTDASSKPADNASSGASQDSGSQNGGSQNGSSQDGAAKDSASEGGAGQETKAQAGSGTGASKQNVGTSTATCKTEDLYIDFVRNGADAPQPGKDAQQTATLTFSNRGPDTCALNGYPGITLKDAAGKTDWDLRRQAGTKIGQISLKPGATTNAKLTFLGEKGDSGDNWKPANVVVTPPNETHSRTIGWPFGDVQLQDSATRPGTFIGQVGA